MRRLALRQDGVYLGANTNGYRVGVVRSRRWIRRRGGVLLELECEMGVSANPTTRCNKAIVANKAEDVSCKPLLNVIVVAGRRE